jgi:hypothetical protein
VTGGRVKHGRATLRVKLGGAATATCRVKLTLTSRRKLGAARVKLSGGNTAILRVKLTSAARKRLARSEKLRARVAVVTVDAAAARATAQSRLKLRR